MALTAARHVYWVILLALGCAGQRSTAPERVAPMQVPSCAENPSRDTTVLDTTQVSRKPEVVSGPRIPYPDELRRQRVSGRVVYALTINADGSLDSASVDVLRSDRAEFERVARQYLQGARFSLGCRDGQAVRVRIALPIDSRILGSSWAGRLTSA